MSTRVRQRSRRQCLPAGKMREVRGRFGTGWRAANGMAEHTRRGQKHLLPALLQGLARHYCRVLLGLEPGGEGCRWLGNHQEGHVSMLVTAKLSALAAKHAWL